MVRHRKQLLILSLVVVFLALFFVLVLHFDDWFAEKVVDGHFSAIENNIERQTVILNGKRYIPRDNVETFLLIGIDAFGKAESSDSYYNLNQADFLVVVVVDHDKQNCSFIHINRDTMALVDRLSITGVKYDTCTEQIALSHTYGDGTYNSCLNTSKAVSRLLSGADIDYYLSITMDGAKIVNDYFGGVPVTMDRDYTEIDPEFEEGSTVILMGDSAINFVRARSDLSNSTNLYRMDRQKLYMNSFLRRISSVGSDSISVTDLFGEIQDYIVTNCDVGKFSDLMNYLETYSHSEVISPAGEAVRGAEVMEFYVDEENLQSIVAEMFFKEVTDK